MHTNYLILTSIDSMFRIGNVNGIKIFLKWGETGRQLSGWISPSRTASG